MHVDEIVRILDADDSSDLWFKLAPFSELERAQANFLAIANSGLTLNQLASICQQFQTVSQDISDPDMALNNLEKFILAARSPLAVGALFSRDETALPILLRIFSASQYLSDLLIRDTESYDSLRLTEGQLYSRDILVDELVSSICNATELVQAMQILRRFKHRESLRIAFGDLIVGHRLEQVVEQISLLAESIIEAALHWVVQQHSDRIGIPLTSDGNRSRFAILALGKLGGSELNYSSDIDLIAVYEADGKTDKAGKLNQTYFEKVTRELIKLLNEVTSLGVAYRVDMRLRPEGSRGPICCSSKSFLQYYDLQGRTWERQALIKARPVAGDLDFGDELLRKLQPWIYRPILNRFDIADIKSLKRQIEHRAVVSGEEKTNVKTGHGGIRDIEFAIQFLQLLNGGVVKDVRTGNTLDAIRKLSAAECLSRNEADLLTQNYCWLRKLEHYLQVMYDLQTHNLPEDDHEVSKIAIRMGYRKYFGASVLQQFQSDLAEITNVNNKILDHLLHNAFAERADSETEDQLNAVDLVLQAQLKENDAERILNEYGFSEAENARRLIDSLAQESTIFLSSRRCRHFLAAIIIDLLDKIAETPDPDFTLVSLANVSDAIGGKGALWELFNFNPPSLDLFVRLCASSEYLCRILCRNSGLIDELVDSLLMSDLPSIDWLHQHLNELTSGATDASVILHSFKNDQHLRIGVRDVVGKDSVRSTHQALADVAEVCVQRTAQIEFVKCAAKHSNLAMPDDRIQQRNGMVILALGKLGGREPNYHSDLDVVFLYESAESKNAWISTSPQHFYSDLAARITKAMTTSGPNGKLFELDSRLRPTGKSGALAVSFSEFQRYFMSGEGQLWERQALCKARAVFGSPELRATALGLARDVICHQPWSDDMAAKIRDMRFRMQENCSERNLKRGVGGTVDVEFIVQMLQLKNARDCPEVLVPGTIEAIELLLRKKAIVEADATFLTESYQYLRAIESRLRLMNTSARHELLNGIELEKLAYLLETDSKKIDDNVTTYRRNNRKLFDELFDTD